MPVAGAALAWRLWPHPAPSTPTTQVATQVVAADWDGCCFDPTSDGPCVRVTNVLVGSGPVDVPAYVDGSGHAQGYCFKVYFQATAHRGSGLWVDVPEPATQCVAYRYRGGNADSITSWATTMVNGVWYRPALDALRGG